MTRALAAVLLVLGLVLLSEGHRAEQSTMLQLQEAVQSRTPRAVRALQWGGGACLAVGALLGLAGFRKS